MRHTYSHIDLDERRKIARWRMASISVEIIAEKFGRHRSTIFRELKRNMFVDKMIPDLNGYYCVTAHDMAYERVTILIAPSTDLVLIGNHRQTAFVRKTGIGLPGGRDKAALCADRVPLLVDQNADEDHATHDSEIQRRRDTK